MGAGKSNLEVEIKLRVEDAASGRRLLRRAGFRVRRRRIFESNVIYDTPGRRLRADGKMLRIRQAGRKIVLTYKGLASPGRHKTREELEVHLSDAERFGQVMDRLGLEPSFYYEKYRTEFMRSGSPGIATLDETPIGALIELEGPPQWIDATARELGFDASSYITKSYAELFLGAGRPGWKRGPRMAFRGKTLGRTEGSP